MQKPVLLIDGNNTAFRCAATTKLSNAKGESVAIPFGVLRSIRYVVQQFNPLEVVVVWDGIRSPYRVKLCPEYKRSAKRVKKRNEEDRKSLFAQIDTTKELLSLLGITQFREQESEADDVIAYLAHRLTIKGKNQVVIVSSDKDFLQLVDRDVSVFNPVKGITWTPTRRWGPPVITKRKATVNPRYYLEFLTIVGDDGDNIPGVPGVGEKTANEFLAAWSVIDIKRGVVKPENFDNKRIQKLVGARSLLVRNKKLIGLEWFRKHVMPHTVKSEIPVPEKMDLGKFYKRVMQKDLAFRSIVSDKNYWAMPFMALSINRRYFNRENPSWRKFIS